MSPLNSKDQSHQLTLIILSKLKTILIPLERQPEQHILHPPRPRPQAHLRLLSLGESETSASALNDLLDHAICDVARWVGDDTIFAQRLLSALDDASGVPGRVNRRGADALAAFVAGQALGADTFRQIESSDLGAAVVEETWRGNEGSHGGDGHDVASLLLEHTGEELAN